MKLFADIQSYFIPATNQKSIYDSPIVVILHGKGDTLGPFRDFQSEIDLPNFNFLLLNAPLRFQKGFSWYGEPPYQMQGVVRARSLVQRVLVELHLEGWAYGNIFLLGFSQGALVSSDVALHMPQALGGVIGVSGYFNFVPRWRSQISGEGLKTPWLMTHGRRDDVLPIEDTRLGLRKLIQIGLKVDWVESEKKHVFDENDYNVIRDWLLSKHLRVTKYPRRARGQAP